VFEVLGVKNVGRGLGWCKRDADREMPWWLALRSLSWGAREMWGASQQSVKHHWDLWTRALWLYTLRRPLCVQDAIQAS